MRARLQLLQSWQRQVRALTVGVRVTQANALALLALGILLAGTVRLPQVARTVPGVAVDASVTRRLRRFLANPRVRVVDLWQPIRRVVLAGYAGRSLTLIFDPTPQAGQATVLMVAVIEHRRALPLIWQVVPQQQKWPDSLDGLLTPMLDQIAADLPPACTVTLVVDRGITGPTLIRRCQALGWHFTFRLSVGPNQTNRLRVDNRDVALWPWLQAHGFAWTGPVELFKEAGWLSLQLTVIWERGYDEPWVLLSDQPAGRTQVRIYRRRSRIEATFADTKRRGFELEQTKLVEFARIDRLLVALALALWWGTQAGLRMIRHGQRRRFDHPRRRDKSVIRLGREVFCDRLERDEQPPLPFRRHGATWCYAHYA